MRVSIASSNPPVRAVRCSRCGSRSTSTAMKMMLSMPRTISSSDSVTKASQAWGSVSVAVLR
jgi:hypothetical protein